MRTLSSRRNRDAAASADPAQGNDVSLHTEIGRSGDEFPRLGSWRPWPKRAGAQSTPRSADRPWRGIAFRRIAQRHRDLAGRCCRCPPWPFSSCFSRSGACSTPPSEATTPPLDRSSLSFMWNCMWPAMSGQADRRDCPPVRRTRNRAPSGAAPVQAVHRQRARILSASRFRTG